ADGGVRWVWERGRLCEDYDDGVARLEGVLADITEQKQAEKALRRAQKMEAIGQLTGGIAHDFNNILGIILGNLDLLQQQSDDPQVRQRALTLQKTAQRAAELTRQLLSFSRKEVAAVTVANINGLVEELASIISRTVTPEVAVEYRLAEDLWLTEIEAGDFQDSLINLVINARDAMPVGGHLVLETHNRILNAIYCAQYPGIKPGEYVELVVKDDGLGMPPEQQEHIFEPFFTTKPKGKGSGLGLAMVFGFVQRSHGHLRVDSVPGKGTYFHIYLPRAERDSLPEEKGQRIEQVLPRGSETILAVDDEPELLALTRDSLSALGYQVLTTNTAKQAMALLSAHPDIDLLFSDVVIPGGTNGYKLAEQALRERPGLKVLLTSGYSEMALTEREQSKVGPNLLHKPYSQMELAQRIRALLDADRP
ncbi:MAG: ATP-binding protein, partial [Chromatiales bacterium]|nr:ATP-binding protein [Chromatiales bacterium]